MMDFLRGFFGMKPGAGTRSVAGAPVSLSIKDAAYILNSQQRLAALQTLHDKYRSTPYAPKIKAVYDKTQHLHAYLLGRDKAHELELFHLQHTDNFLNTFSTIIDTHRQHTNQKPVKSSYKRNVPANPFRQGTPEAKEALQQNMETGRKVLADAIAAKLEVPRLTAVQVSINTYSRIVYLDETSADKSAPLEIGFTSSAEEKEVFAQYVSGRLGIEEVSYLGNALISLPDSSGPQLPELAPVIQWNGFAYIFSIENFQLFPVYTHRRSR